jgi:hypothetical protein
LKTTPQVLSTRSNTNPLNQAAMFMFVASPCPLPADAMPRTHDVKVGFVDCFFIDVNAQISHSQFVAAFYTSWLFKIERFILRWVVAKPSTNAEAQQLAMGEHTQFAAWALEARAENQLLMGDYPGATCSWLICEALAASDPRRTRLYFGSAIALARSPSAQARRGTASSRGLLWLHTVYSKALLDAACRARRK